MRYFVLGLCLIIFSTAAYCQDSGRVYWGGVSPKDVAARANGMSFGSGSGGDGCAIPMGGMNFDPAMGMMNSMMMMQNGGQGLNNPYQMQDQQRQQIDYAKQQMKQMQEMQAQEDKEDAAGKIKPVRVQKSTKAKVYDEGEENFNTEW